MRVSNSWWWLECEKASRFATLAKPDIRPVQLVTQCVSQGLPQIKDIRLGYFMSLLIKEILL